MSNNSFFTTKLFYSIIFLAVFSCAKSGVNSITPKWYDSPRQNDSSYLYGVSQGQTIAEATKMSLVDMASRLVTTKTLLEENKFDSNEELRMSVSQNIEKISFNNLQVSNSVKIYNTFFVETRVDRNQFILEQRERIKFLKVKIANLDKSSLATNSINRRNSLIEILDISKELELKARMIAGAGENVNLEEILKLQAKYQNEFEKFTNKIEVYFAPNVNGEIKSMVTKYLNNEKIKIVESPNGSKNQILLRISS